MNEGTLDHHETAELILRRLSNSPGWYGGTPNIETLARAQVHATLAVADLLRESSQPRIGARREHQ